MAVLKHTTAGFGLGLASLVLGGAYSLSTTSELVEHYRRVWALVNEPPASRGAQGG